MSFGVLSILISNDKRFILQHRDNKPDIYMPNKIGLFGGSSEDGEKPEESIIRELKEELELSTPNHELQFFKVYKNLVHTEFNREEYFYIIKNINIELLKLHEGQAILTLRPEEFKNYEFCPGCLLVLNEYLQLRNFTK